MGGVIGLDWVQVDAVAAGMQIKRKKRAAIFDAIRALEADSLRQ